MHKKIELNAIHEKIKLLRSTTQELSSIGEDYPAIVRNTARIMASIKMLEINISDAVELESQSLAGFD